MSSSLQLETESSSSESVQSALYIAELALLALVLIFVLMHILSFGCLYMRAPITIIDLCLILVNAGMSVALLSYGTERLQQELFGSKALLMLLFTLTRVQISQVSLQQLRKPHSTESKVAPDNQTGIRKSLTDKSKMEVVSVRAKVIEELRMVQTRLAEGDVKSDVALEYCIKMIANN